MGQREAVIRSAQLKDLNDYIAIKSESSALYMAGWEEPAPYEVYKKYYEKIIADKYSRCFVVSLGGGA